MLRIWKFAWAIAVAALRSDTDKEDQSNSVDDNSITQPVAVEISVHINSSNDIYKIKIYYLFYKCHYIQFQI